jgi:Flp pilus assembly protein TadD
MVDARLDGASRRGKVMGRRSVGIFGYGLVAIAMAVVPLSGCSSMAGLGASSFGSNKLQVAEISNIGDYTSDRALSEARGHFRNNDYGYSAALYKRVVDLSPKDPEGYVGLGASYDRLGRFDLSDRVYASLYAISGGTAQYYNNVGYSYMLRGNLTAALTNFRKAKQLAPDSVVVANNIQILHDAAAARA